MIEIIYKLKQNKIQYTMWTVCQKNLKSVVVSFDRLVETIEEGLSVAVSAAVS